MKTSALLSARDAKSSGALRIENCQQPNRSAVSRDGGYSWDSDHLAEGGYCDGELFQVRLNLARYAPAAWLQSPVIDMAMLLQPIGLPAAEARIEELTVDAQRPAGTAVSTFLRTGATPDGFEENWSRWYAWPAEAGQIKYDRFVQSKLALEAEPMPGRNTVTAPQIKVHNLPM